MSRIKLIGMIAALSITAAACSTAQAADVDAGRIDTTTTTVSIAPTETVTTTTTTTLLDAKPDTTPPQGARPARKLDEVKAAVVQIVAHGSFATPNGELINVPGSGSGFLIDGSGLAVTNNHVVTGAAYLDVYVDGEVEPRNAQIVGVSECSDLAVIDIEGEFDIHLEWHDGTPLEGRPVYVAGFPLGDPQYTLYDGIVAKTDSGGESAWASVSNELEHSANTKPGNSGSPIVTPHGAVIGVHYASGGLDQAYGISVTEAASIVDELRRGRNVASIGINGEAFVTESGFSGIWVSSVKSGSPAATAGVRAGDIVSRLEHLVLAQDGTMAEYCKVLRSHDATEQMSIEVLRLDTGEELRGMLNSSPLEVVGSLGGDEPSQEGGGNGSTTESVTYVSVSHTTGTMTMDVPDTWSDVEDGAWRIDGQWVGRRLAASPDMDSWRESWGTPGAQFLASSQLAQTFTPTEFLDTRPGWASCTYEGRYDYDDGVYAGVFEKWAGCGSSGATYYEVAATPADGSHLAFIQIIEVDEADLEATMKVLSTFMVSGTV